jgi:hypothetical protein
MSLSTNAIYSAIGLAEQFDARGIALVPVAGSPLHHLVASTFATPDMACQLESGEVSIDFFRLEQSANAKDATFDRSRHDYAMDDFIAQASGAVQNVLYVTRNKVSPRIAELLELVTMRLSNAPVSELSRVRITEDDDCPAVYGPALRKLVDQFANYPNDAEPRLAINGPDLATAEILKLLETGVASIDEELIAWAAAQPEYVLQDAYKNFFTTKNGSRDVRGFYGRMNNSVVTMVLVYCIARNLIENDQVLEGVSLDLKEYREVLKGIMSQSAHMLSIQMEKNDAAIRNGNMVKSIAASEVRVFPPVYREWLAKGGNTDVLYGMAISGNQKFTVDAITANQAEYLQAWRGYSSMITSRDSVARLNFLKDQLVLSYESILNKPNEDGVSADAHAVKAEMDVFRSILRGMTATDADDLHGLCLKLVCRTSFANSPAEMFLSKMDEEAKRNPGLSAREAGALATLWYISSWVAALIEPVPVNSLSVR